MTQLSLEKILQSQGFGSRKFCRQLIHDGSVRIAGTVCTTPDTLFNLENLVIEVAGEHWPCHLPAYLMLHKPAGYECSRTPLHHPSIFSLLPLPLQQRNIQCVGRLDQDTTGLLLLSDDGAFIHALTSPRRHVPKHYAVQLRHEAREELTTQLLNGVLLHQEKTPVCALSCSLSDTHTLLLSLGEGKYHQVKRMVAAAGNRVDGLHRHAIGGLALDSTLLPGQWRWLTPEELARIPYTPAA